MQKRIISVLIVLATLFSLVFVPVHAEDYLADNTHLDVLKALEIVYGYEQNENDAFSKMSKSTFINFLLNMIEGGKYTGDYDRDALTQAQQLGLIEDAGAVSVSDTLKRDEAVKMAMALLGYKDICLAMGGYPAGFNAKANQVGLTDDLMLSDEMTNAEGYNLLYSAMNTGVLDIIAIGDDGMSFAEYEDKTILSIYRKIFRVEGVVTANGTSGLYDTAAVSPGYVTIGEDLFEDPSNQLYDYIGYKVLAFAKRHAEGSFEIVYGKMHNTQKVTEIASNDILSVTSDISQIEYYKGDGASTSSKVMLPATIALLYNNVVKSDYTNADFTKKDGKVILIDHQGDNNIDVVKLDFAKTMIVSAVSISSRVINGEYNFVGALTKLDLKNYETDGDKIEITLNGEPASLDTIQQGDVLSIYDSEGSGSKYLRIRIIRDKVNATVTARYDARDEIAAGDFIYELSDLYKKANAAHEIYAEDIKVGSNYDLYLDKDGRVAAAKIASTGGLTFGYLRATAAEGVFGATVTLKIFGADGSWKDINLAKKVRVNGDSTDDAIDAKVKADQAIGKLIGYTLNGDDEIARLETPVKYYEGISSERLNYIDAKSGNWRYNGTYFDSDVDTFMDTSTVVFFTPSDQINNENLYGIGNSYSFTTDESISSYIAYGNDEYGFADLVLISQEAEQGKTIKWNDPMYFIREVGTGLDADGNEVQQITVASATYYGLSIMIDNEYSETMPSIQAGDLIRVHVNAAGYIDNMELEYQVANKKELFCPVSINSADPAKGIVEKLDASGGRVLIRTIIDKKEKTQALKVSPTIPVTIYDLKRNTVSNGKLADLAIEDYIVVDIEKSTSKGIYVYRNL